MTQRTTQRARLGAVFGAVLAAVTAGATACTSILGDFTVGSAPVENEAGDAQGADVVDSGPPDVQPDAESPFLGGVTHISAGARHTCAVVGTDVYCWGDNTNGQLARPAGVSRSARPLKVDLPEPITGGISAGAFHTCALGMGSHLFCWGANDCGQAGAGDAPFQNPAPPRQVAKSFTWVVVAAGEKHTCAVEASGATYCWGCNDQQQSGGVGASPVSTPTNAGADKLGFRFLAASAAHTCAASDTIADCWGTEMHGELGNNTAASSSSSAVAVQNVNGVHALSVGAAHSCILDADDNAHCWGDNSTGQLGLSDAGAQLLVAGPAIAGGTYKALAAKGGYTCFIASSGDKVSCVGANDQGQLGRGGTSDSSPHFDPQPVVSPDGSGTPLVAKDLAAGREHACAIQPNGGAVCWGTGADGQIGDGMPGGPPRTTPVHVVKP